MVLVLVGQIIQDRLGVPVVAMKSRIRVQRRNPVKYVIKILEEGLLPHYTPGMFFLQDKARIPNAKVTKEWLQ